MVVVAVLVAAAAAVVVVVVVVAAAVVVSLGMILCLWEVGRTNGLCLLKRYDLRTYGRTDRPSYRDNNQEVDNDDEI